MNARHWGWLAIGALGAAPQAAMADRGLRLDTQMFVERIGTDLNGRARRTLHSASRAAPGDRIIYVITFRNESEEAVRGITLTRPLPRGARLNGAVGDVMVSVDNGDSWGRLDRLWVPTPLHGTRRATPDDVTHVRWTLASDIPPGEGGRLSYRATMR
ncbi:MAG: hypothetical protein ABW048_10315 [Sphingobium sp.]